MNANKLAAALRAAADAVEDGGETVIAAPVGIAAPAPAATPRGRGRPPKVEAPAAPVAPAADPFEDAKTPAPTATQADVRAALTALAAATSQENALKVMQDVGGAANLSGLLAAKYADVIQAAIKATPAAAAAPEVEADPFETSAPAAPAVEAKKLTQEDVRAAAVAAQKRTSQDTVQKVIMEHGGKGPLSGGGEGPSLKALPESKYGETIAALAALPSTK